MIFLKAIFKWVFKWLFRLTNTMGESENPFTGDRAPRNGRYSAPPSDARADVAADTLVVHIRQAIRDLEDTLHRKPVPNGNGATTGATATQTDPDVYAMRAELAELKADLRALRRMMQTDTEPGDLPQDEP